MPNQTHCWKHNRLRPQKTGLHIASFVIIVSQLLLAGCSATLPPKTSSGHITAPVKTAPSDIPAPVAQSTFLPLPAPAKKEEIYTVVVNEVPVKEMLFALARDASLNVDIHPGIKGKVTINAVKQSMSQILARISEQVAIRYTLDGNNLVISPDVPFFRTYKVNYVNMSRETQSNVSVATQVSSTGSGVNASGGSGGGASGGGSSGATNKSQTSVNSQINNDFWGTLTSNVKQILRQNEDPLANAKLKLEDDNRVVANPHGGVLTVFGNQRQQRRIQEFLDQVLASAQRQVLIEMTIVEVELSDRYQAGIDWQFLSGNSAATGSAVSSLIPAAANSQPGMVFDLGLSNAKFDFNMGINMLESFGNAKVLSSPKIMALNNQTALLKIVDEKVYFEVLMDIQVATTQTPERQTFTSEIRTIPIGIILAVTPQINENGNVTMNIRPTITRITGYVSDPVPRLQGADFENLIPEIQVREMESLLRVRDNQTIVLGGLMQNKTVKNSRGMPWFATLPWIGNLFNYRDDELIKTELVIFLRPVITGNRTASIQSFESYLPPAEPKEKSGNKSSSRLSNGEIR